MSNENLMLAARTAHEVNRAYCEGFGDFSIAPWGEATEDIKKSALLGMQFLIDNPEATPESQHESWKKNKVADGWIYGPVKDSQLKTHPCIVPYSELPIEQRVKDDLFQAVGRNVLREFHVS